MIVYSLLMFACAVLFFIVGIRIYRGKTELIHEYHQTNVTDKAGYGKAMGKAMLGMGAVMAASGGISGFAASETMMLVSVAVLAAGILADLLIILYIQKKYNGGLF